MIVTVPWSWRGCPVVSWRSWLGDKVNLLPWNCSVTGVSVCAIRLWGPAIDANWATFTISPPTVQHKTHTDGGFRFISNKPNMPLCFSVSKGGQLYLFNQSHIGLSGSAVRFISTHMRGCIIVSIVTTLHRDMWRWTLSINRFKRRLSIIYGKKSSAIVLTSHKGVVCVCSLSFSLQEML